MGACVCLCRPRRFQPPFRATARKKNLNPFLALWLLCLHRPGRFRFKPQADTFHLNIKNIVFLNLKLHICIRSKIWRWSIFYSSFLGSLETVKATQWMFLRRADVSRYLSFGNMNTFELFCQISSKNVNYYLAPVS